MWWERAQDPTASLDLNENEYMGYAITALTIQQVLHNNCVCKVILQNTDMHWVYNITS
jgi:hypothetical protein